MRATRSETVWHGVLTGLIGYVTVAFSVSLGDLMQGRSFFYTVSLLGEWLFYGLKDPAQVVVWPGAVLAYNGLHLVTFLAFGLLASWLVTVSERGPLLWYAALVMYLFFFIHLFGAVLFMTEPLRSAIPMLQIVAPSILALVFMSAFLLRTHPQLRREMREWVDDTEIDAPDAEARRPAVRS